MLALPHIERDPCSRCPPDVRPNLSISESTRLPPALQLCVNTVLPLAPLALGRAVLVLGGLSARHDLYAAILGAYVLWAGGLLLRQIYRLSQARTCTLLCQRLLSRSGVSQVDFCPYTAYAAPLPCTVTHTTYQLEVRTEIATILKSLS